MKVKYLGTLIVGILVVGSFSVLAQEVNLNTQVNRLGVEEITGVYEQNEKRQISANDEAYNGMKKMMEQQVAAGNLTEEQAKDMIDYCLERMENTNRSNRGFGCH
ncbi:MAG: hypothetical protein H9893_07545 [Candidatus Niameybacter stercoravium]|nr:hypothetical protein [Candidatus Niameybacter stercoravium]